MSKPAAACWEIANAMGRGINIGKTYETGNGRRSVQASGGSFCGHVWPNLKHQNVGTSWNSDGLVRCFAILGWLDLYNDKLNSQVHKMSSARW